MPTLTAIKWESTEDSSNVNALYHHEAADVLCVRFKSGGLYTYMGADHEMFMSLKHAPSVGRYLNQVVKALPYTRWETEADILNYLNISNKFETTCIRCDLGFTTPVEGRRVCDDCWADDPT